MREPPMPFILKISLNQVPDPLRHHIIYLFSKAIPDSIYETLKRGMRTQTGMEKKEKKRVETGNGNPFCDIPGRNDCYSLFPLFGL